MLVMSEGAAPPLSIWSGADVLFVCNSDTIFRLAFHFFTVFLSSSALILLNSEKTHCRGADMKLHRDALAVVTLGVGVQKDQLIQAVGRMRELGPGRQTVRFAVPSEVCAQMEQSGTPVDANGILNWCIHNSISQVASGLSQWASQGMHFHKLSPLIELQPNLACEDVSLGLEVMYKDSLESVPIVESVQAEREHFMSSAGLELSESTLRSVDAVLYRVDSLGAGFSTQTTTGIGEECERELENERELLEEIEMEIPSELPCSERDWAYSALLEAEDISDIVVTSGAVSLGNFIEEYIGAMAFAEDAFQHIFATKNFCQTVQRSTAGSKDMENFLRTVDVCIVFSCRRVLLVSEREADCILALFWDSCKSGNHSRSSTKLPTFVNFRYLSQSESGKHVRLGLHCKSEVQGANNCPDERLAALQVFNGDTNFWGPDGCSLSRRVDAVTQLVRASLKNVESSDDKSTDILKFAVARGMSLHIAGSDLQRMLQNE